jgi:dipeptide/tripeptide permease
LTQPIADAAPAADAAAPPSFLEQVRSFGRPFWMVNVMEMLERLAYYGVRVVIPIYIAQADELNGLHFTQSEKATIFFWWALFQSLTPMFSGGFADRYGYKRTIAVSVLIRIVGYLLMATQRTYGLFLFGCCVLALGTAIFKPGVQGTLARSTTARNSSVGWGFFYMVVNVGGWLGPPLAHYLKGVGWPAVFYGCAGIVALNLLVLFTYEEVPSGASATASPLEVLRLTVRNVVRPRLFLFIVIMSGFWLMFMPLYDTLPNFIVDWVDSVPLVTRFHVPSWMCETGPRGVQISQEWMINLDAGLIVLLVVPVSALVARMRRLTSIACGIVVASAGLMIAGATMSGALCLVGIAVFAFGEMLASPKMNEYLGVIAPPDQKGLYMGYANIPHAVGWALSAKVSGWVYEAQGEKANLALRYLAEKTPVGARLGGAGAVDVERLPALLGIDRTQAFETLLRTLHLDAATATRLLWDTYRPYRLWYVFVSLGLASALGMVIYNQLAKRWAGANA